MLRQNLIQFFSSSELRSELDVVMVYGFLK